MIIVQPLLHNHYSTVNKSLYAGSIRGTFNSDTYINKSSVSIMFEILWSDVNAPEHGHYFNSCKMMTLLTLFTVLFKFFSSVVLNFTGLRSINSNYSFFK